MEKETKGALRSKGVIGGLLVIISSLGVLPFGVDFNIQTGDVTLNVYDIVTAVGVAAIPGGGLLAWLGRLGARRVIKGLW